MVDIDIREELANVNSSQAFWRALGSDYFTYGCSCAVSHAPNHFVMKPSYFNTLMNISMRIKERYDIQFKEMLSDNGSEFSSKNNPDHHLKEC